MMETRVAVRSQLIPITGDNLLLPNTAVAEVIYYQEPQSLAGPKWLLGMLTWRERSVPLVSFEMACAAKAEESDQALATPNARAKVAVLNTLNGNPELNFIAVVTQGLPKLMLIDENKIASIEHEIETSPLILSRVIVNDEPALIPNLDALEEMLMAHKPTWVPKRRKRKS